MSRGAPWLGLRAQIVLSLCLVFLLSFWLLGFATVQITRRSAVLDRSAAERLLERTLAVEWDAPAARSDEALVRACGALRTTVGLTGLVFARADGTRFVCGHVGVGTSAGSPLSGGDRLLVQLPAPAQHNLRSIAHALLFYMALTGLAVALLAYVLLTYLIVHPLERLTRSAEQFALGVDHLDVAVKEAGSAEAVRLARTFNEMATLLRAERKQLTDRLAELERTSAELQHAQRQLIHGEKLASIGRLAAGVAHEIGNPLAAILGLVELLRAGDLPAEQSAEFLARVAAETERINRIIRDLLDFARKDSAGAQLGESCDLASAIADAVGLVRPQRTSKDVAIEVVIAPQLRRVFGSQQRLTQVVLNLLLNALDALAGAGRIEIRVEAEPDGQRVCLRVSDDGPGIAPEIAHELFEPFSTTKPPGKGTGLGLAVAHAIVDALDGTIEAHNRTEGGAVFEVRLRQVSEQARQAVG
jgi:two-component system NtrC family sensor kinase